MALPARPDAPAAPMPPAVVLLLLTGLVLVKHAMAGSAPDGFTTTGLLADSDSWVRAHRVLDLWQGAGWFEETVHRLNPPLGLSVHWTRPLDVLILLPAQALSGAFGFAPRDAVLLAGAWVCPVLHVCCAAAAVFAARAVWTGIGPLLAGLLVAGNPMVGGYSLVGRADHHTLILLFGLLALGSALAATTRPDARGAAWRSGAFAGAGVWVSPEALLFAAPVLAGFGVLWVVEGARGIPTGAAAQGLRASLGFALVAAVAVAVEHPPSGWLDGEYDKVSAQHVLMGALGAAVFAGATRVAGDALRRAAAGGAAAAVALGVLLALRPGALTASLAGADADVAAHFMPLISEMQPIPLALADLFGEAPAMLGAAPAALLALALAVPVWRREGKLGAAAPLGLALAVALPAALLHRRLAVDLAAPACLLAAGLPGLALGGLRRPVLRPAAAFLAVAAILGTPFLGLIGAARAEGHAAPPTEECGVAALEAQGRQRRATVAAHAAAAGGDPVLLTDSLDLGPELAWRTPFRVVGALYHRGGDALVDNVTFFAARDDATALAIAARRRVSMVLVCAAPPSAAAAAETSLLARLRRDETPGWMEPVPLPGAPAGVRLYAVRPPTAHGAAASIPGK